MSISIAYLNSCSDLTGTVNSKMMMDLTAGMHDAAMRSGASVHTFDLSTPVDAFIAGGRDKHYDGFIGAVPRSIPAWQKAWNSLEERKPCVNIMIESARSGSRYVGTDEHAAVRLLVDHLVREGHRDIGYAVSSSEPYALERREGFAAALHAHGIPLRDDWVFNGDRLHRRGMRDAKARHIIGQIALIRSIEKAAGDWFFGLAERPTALMLDNAALAAFMHALLTRTGQDTAITAFDDEPARTGVNAITTVRQDFFRIGRESVLRVVALLQGKHPSARLLIRPALVPRASTLRHRITDERFRQTVCGHIARHYRDDSARDIASVFGMNRDAFGRKCRRLLGQSYIALLTEARLKRAAAALRSTARPVTAVVSEAGFRSYQHFCRQFKKHFRITPAAYRSGHSRKTR
ncbi:MAG: substrate-binding domain-containing protein [Spirochaetes bacterium]|nr:substrate-binding domain-containing protein [Spirochaetota bacterium]